MKFPACTTIRGWIAAITLGASAACAPLASPLDAEVLVNTAPGEYELGVVQISTAVDLATGRGEDFDVLGGVKVAGLEGIDTLGRRDLYSDYEALRTRNRETAGGVPVAPNLTTVDGVVRGTDFDSLQYLTIFHNFEQVFAFYRDVVEDRSEATSDFGIVGFYAELVLSSVAPVPILGADNAAYYPMTDGWLTLRVADIESIPLAMNPAVIAHEFGHRSFMANVFRSSDAAFEIWRTNTATTTPDNRTLRATNLLRGVDEGLADLQAVAFSRDPNFVAPSVAVAEVSQTRDLNGEYAQFATYAILDDASLIASTGIGCTGPDLSESGFNFYCLGTVLVRALWVGADSDVEVLRNEISPAVVRALPNLGDRIVAETDANETIDFEIEYILEAIAAELTGTRQNRVCDAFRSKFFQQVTNGLVPSCN